MLGRPGLSLRFLEYVFTYLLGAVKWSEPYLFSTLCWLTLRPLDLALIGAQNQKGRF